MFAREEQQDIGRTGRPQTPSDGDLFGAPLTEQPAYGDIFSSLAGFASEPDLPVSGARSPIPCPGMRPPLHLNRLSNLQKGKLADDESSLTVSDPAEALSSVAS